MSFEVFGGGDERDWSEELSRRGWITHDDGATWERFEGDGPIPYEQAAEALRSWLEDED